MRNLALGFTIGAGIGASGCYVLLSTQLKAKNEASSKVWPLSDTRALQAASELGIPVTEALVAYDGFAASFDYRTRNARWVLEKVTKESLEGKASRNSSQFHEDASLDPLLRAKLEDFKDSGYDRGHLAPAADHKGSQRAMDDTFSLVNISPQVGAGFNRDYWERFERYVRSLAKKGEEVYVVTGPLWLPRPSEEATSGSDNDLADNSGTKGSGGRWTMRHSLIGTPPALVSVPTHFYKVILSDGKGEGGSRRVGVGAFLIPNQEIEGRTPLSAFAVPLEALEQVAGARFFPNFLSANAERTRVISQGAVAWRSHALSTMRPFDRLERSREIVPLLGPPSSSPSPVISAASSLPSDPAPPPPPPPKPRLAAGVCHLCDITDGCRLPGPMSFSSNNQASSPAEKKEKGGGGHSGGKRTGGGKRH